MKHNKKKKQKTGAGFSLIEILIVITLLGIGLVGILAFFNSSIISHTDAKNELIAAGLAQEGPELVRNLADWKKLHNEDWNQIISELTPSSTQCRHIDYRSLTSHNCQNTATNYICFSNGRYLQCNSGTSDMQRTLTIQHLNDVANGDHLEITSTVTWNSRTTTAVDRLYENEY